MNKCVFLDRDGVLNEDRVDYVYRIEDFKILPQVHEALQLLKKSGYLLIIITNQSGIAKGIYSPKDVLDCYNFLQDETSYLIDYQYFATYHPQYDSESLTRKPDSLMIEKAVAKFKIDIAKSWFVGDAERDMEAAKKINLRTIQITDIKTKCELADFETKSLYEAANFILNDFVE